MKRRSMGLGLVAGLAVLAGASLVGCGSDGGPSGGETEVERGTLQLPLLTEGASGAKYRLRDATFEVIGYNYYYGYEGSAGGEGGTGSRSLTVSSEDDPDAASIVLSVERGDYYVRLLPGWRMEKIDGGGALDVEATLLSSNPQWVSVYAHSSSWVEYEFGLGDRSLWFNGKLNIDIRVHEDPSEIYGSGGEPGAGGAFGYGGDAG